MSSIWQFYFKEENFKQLKGKKKKRRKEVVKQIWRQKQNYADIGKRVKTEGKAGKNGNKNRKKKETLFTLTRTIGEKNKTKQKRKKTEERKKYKLRK